MNTRLQFKIIGALIICSIVGVTILQGYWLKGLYDTTWQQTERTIEEGMRRADYTELFLRMKDEKRALEQPAGFASNQTEDENGTYSYSRTFHYSVFDQLTGHKKDTNPDESTTVRIVITEEEIESPDMTETVEEYFQVIGQLEKFILLAMHQDLDTVLPVNYARYDSLICQELKKLTITTPYLLELVSATDGHAIPLTTWDETIQFTKGSPVFEYPIMGSDQFYRLTLKAPYRIILKKMAGLLISSFLLILLVIIAFIYLLCTILQQKSMEEMKTDFTNNVTHELKTPLAVAFAAADSLLNYDGSITDKQKKYLKIIQEQMNRLTGMVEQILTLSVENRATFRLHPEEVNVAQLLPSLLEQQKLKTRKQVDITCGLPPDFTIQADKTHLYHMISNLVDNAIKYGDKEPVEIEITGRSGHKETTLSVKDNGAGISEHHQAHIFEKFYRVPQGNLHNVKGYGLGLYYIQDMMNKHRGKVTLKSRPGKGSVFTLHFRP